MGLQVPFAGLKDSRLVGFRWDPNTVNYLGLYNRRGSGVKGAEAFGSKFQGLWVRQGRT